MNYSVSGARQIILGVLFAVFCVTAATAEPRRMTGPEALAAQSSGDLIIIDVRTPPEWKESGVADGAFLLDMRNEKFVDKLVARMAQRPGTPVAFICATGARSNHVATQLEKIGISGIVDISEGMYGSDVGPGWLARGLPLRQFKEPTMLDRLLRK